MPRRVARGQQVIQYDCHGGKNQQWRVQYLTESSTGPTFFLINVWSGKCLDASDYGNGEDVIQWECNFRQQHQLWKWEGDPQGTRLINVKSGKCLDAADYGRGERIIQYDCLRKGLNQVWYD